MSGPVAESTLDVLNRMLSINLTTALLTTRAFLPALRRTRGAIVLFASQAALPGGTGANMSAYTIAKTGVAVLARAIAAEERRNGVRANALAPISIRTAANLSSMGPNERYIEREQVADVVTFLCSPAASAITGEIDPAVMTVAVKRRAGARTVLLDRSLEEFPLFRLSDTTEDASISYLTDTGGRWRVLASPGDRLPGTFDQDVYVELMRRYLEAGQPSDGAVSFTLHSFLRSTGRQADGRTYEQLRGALTRLERTVLQSERSYFDAGVADVADLSFTLPQLGHDRAPAGIRARPVGSVSCRRRFGARRSASGRLADRSPEPCGSAHGVS